MTKTEYLQCGFSGVRCIEGDASLEGQIVSKRDTLLYMGSMLQSNNDIDEDGCHKIKEGWIK
jgi:hypothetical protein